MKELETRQGASQLPVCLGMLVVLEKSERTFKVGKVTGFNEEEEFPLIQREPDFLVSDSDGADMLWRRDSTIPLYAYSGPMLNLGPFADMYTGRMGANNIYIGSGANVSYGAYRRMNGDDRRSEEWAPGKIAAFRGASYWVAVNIKGEMFIVEARYPEIMDRDFRYHQILETWIPKDL